MNQNARVQVRSALGIAIAVPAVYLGLKSGNETIAYAAVVLFGVCILATPALKLKQLLTVRSGA